MAYPGNEWSGIGDQEKKSYNEEENELLMAYSVIGGTLSEFENLFIMMNVQGETFES